MIGEVCWVPRCDQPGEGAADGRWLCAAHLADAVEIGAQRRYRRKRLPGRCPDCGGKRTWQLGAYGERARPVCLTCMWQKGEAHP